MPPSSLLVILLAVVIILRSTFIVSTLTIELMWSLLSTSMPSVSKVAELPLLPLSLLFLLWYLAPSLRIRMKGYIWWLSSCSVTETAEEEEEDDEEEEEEGTRLDRLGPAGEGCGNCCPCKPPKEAVAFTLTLESEVCRTSLSPLCECAGTSLLLAPVCALSLLLAEKAADFAFGFVAMLALTSAWLIVR